MNEILQHNYAAEQALLGRLILDPAQAEACGIQPSDLEPGLGHPEILSAILTCAETKGAADPVLLVEELRARDQLARIGHADHRSGVYLADLIEAGRGVGTVGHYALLVREATVRRRLWEVGTRLVRTATTQGDIDVVLDNASDLSVVLGLLVDQPVDGDVPVPGLGPVEDFVLQPSARHSWVVPGLVERADRVMLIGGEGIGKSMVARQICTMLAAGLHPFGGPGGLRIRPRRTLLIDLENPVDLVRRSLRGLVTNVWDHELSVGDRAWRWTRPGGMDLRTLGDRQQLARAIEQTRPDLVAIGPVYKAFAPRPGDDSESGPAEFGRAVDHLRERYGCAFWVEHHAPHVTDGGKRGRPIGSSFWLRWPEFGLVLRALDSEEARFELARFRGDRDVRAFPEVLVKSGRTPGAWPWTPDYEPETKSALFEACDEDAAEGPP